MRTSNYPPGPLKLPLIGNTFLIKKLTKKYGGHYLALLKLCEQYKSNIISLKLGRDYYVVVFGRELVQQVFTKEEFQARPDGFFLRLRTMGARRGITMTDGPLWQEQRNFTDRHLRQMGYGKIKMENLIIEELDKVFSSIGTRQDDISLSQKLSSSVLNVLWIITGGKQLSKDDRLDDLLSLLRKRSKAFDMAGGILNQLPWIRFIFPNYSGYTVIQSLNSKLFELFQDIIDEHKRTLTSETRDFVDAYLHEESQSSSGSFTDDQLVAICLDLFIGGSLTTTYTLDFAILYTVSNPHVQEKLHQEIDQVLSRDQKPTLADRVRLPYVEAVLSEAMRIQCVVPTAGPRRTLRNTSLGGYQIPKDTIVLMSLRSIHYDPELFPDPEKFIPERFLDENGNFSSCEKYAFGIGKRRCPGEALAKSFLFLAFTSLFQNFNISFPEGKKPELTKPTGGILLAPSPYTVNLQARSGNSY